MGNRLFFKLSYRDMTSCLSQISIWRSKLPSASVVSLRPAGGVKHSDSDLVETRMLSAKKALR